MKLKFFLVILAVFVLSTIATTWIHFYFLRDECLQLIDNQLRKTAAILVNSELADLRKLDLEKGEQIISEKLGDDRIGMIFLLYNEKGELEFQSRTSKLLETRFPFDDQWVTQRLPDHFIRLLNIEIPNRQRTLQVGLILNPGFLEWGITSINPQMMGYLLLTGLLIFLISAGLTVILLSPIQKLTSELRDRSNLLNGGFSEIQSLPSSLLKLSRGFFSKSDEFATLLSTIQSLLEKINRYHKISGSWSLQMAHELKTPLTIIRMGIENLAGKIPETASRVQEIQKEMDHLTLIINRFLDWADLENTLSPSNLHAVELGSLLKKTLSSLDIVFPGRIHFSHDKETTVFADPLHLTQVINNLVTNALKYSPPQAMVRITLKRGTLAVEDSGSGIPPEVLERLGQPFNRAKGPARVATEGTGLGLAWVNTLTRLYGWKLHFESSSRGTIVTVVFGALRLPGPGPFRFLGSQTSTGSNLPSACHSTPLCSESSTLQ